MKTTRYLVLLALFLVSAATAASGLLDRMATRAGDDHYDINGRRSHQLIYHLKPHFTRVGLRHQQLVNVDP